MLTDVNADYRTKKIANFEIITNELNTLIKQHMLSFYITLAPKYICSD
jgi:hypothetical protein